MAMTNTITNPKTLTNMMTERVENGVCTIERISGGI